MLADQEKAESGLHEIPKFKRMIQGFESGADPILNGAPVLLAFHAKRTDGYGDINAEMVHRRVIERKIFVDRVDKKTT
jgi:hypothetical protein